MTLTGLQLIKRREQQIKSNDHSDDIYIDALLTGAKGKIAETLKYFRDHYAVDGVLSVSEMRSNVNNDDYELWQDFIQQYGPRLMKDEAASYRLKSAKQQAGIDREHLLDSMVAISIAYAALGVNDYNDQTLMNEATQSMRFQNRFMRTRGDAPQDTSELVETGAIKLINATAQGLSMEDRVWLRTDALRDQVTATFDRAFQVGLDDAYYQGHLFKEDSKSSNSASKHFKSAKGYLANSLLRDKKAGMAALAGAIVAEKNSLNVGYWYNVEDGHVCEQCIQLTDASPYSSNDIPDAPHNGCRCFVVYYKI